MSSTTTAQTVPGPRAGKPWGLWRRQVKGILRLELKKAFGGGRGLWLYLLAAAPIAVFALLWLIPETVRSNERMDTTVVYSSVYQVFTLRFVIYLAAVAIFGSLIRREILDRSLHFYFLAPLRREVLVVGKFLTGLLVSVALFSLSTLVSFLLAAFLKGGEAGTRYLFHGPGLSHLGSYLLVTALACLGYGAVFLMFGCFFKSPAIPALAVFAWEMLHFLLPPFLKSLTITHYLQSLVPVPLPAGPLAVLADAPSPWVAIPGLIVLSGALVVISGLRVRNLEVHYEED